MQKTKPLQWHETFNCFHENKGLNMPRVNIQQQQPEAYQAMIGLEKYLASSTMLAL